MTDLLKELEAVVGLAEKATNDEPWQVDQEGDVVCNGEDVAWAITNKLDAPYIAALNNLFRTHHAEIAEAVKDARRYRWLLANAQTIEGRQDWYWWADDADVTPLTERIDASIGAMHNSAHEACE